MRYTDREAGSQSATSRQSSGYVAQAKQPSVAGCVRCGGGGACERNSRPHHPIVQVVAGRGWGWLGKVVPAHNSEAERQWKKQRWPSPGAPLISVIGFDRSFRCRRPKMVVNARDARRGNQAGGPSFIPIGVPLRWESRAFPKKQQHQFQMLRARCVGSMKGSMTTPVPCSCAYVARIASSKSLRSLRNCVWHPCTAGPAPAKNLRG